MTTRLPKNEAPNYVDRTATLDSFGRSPTSGRSSQSLENYNHVGRDYATGTRIRRNSVGTNAGYVRTDLSGRLSAVPRCRPGEFGNELVG